MSEQVMTRAFIALERLTDPRAEHLSSESQAALRQFSTDRLIGYGVDRADALRLREMVLAGAEWRAAAANLADTCRLLADEAASHGSELTSMVYLRRASALLRMSQVMMLEDTPDRCELYREAGRLYGAAAQLSGDRSRVTLSTPTGPMVGWHLTTTSSPIGAALVIGGVEGWAMDFDCIGEALAARGVETLMLDGPGQGETRFEYGNYLTEDWRHAYTVALDFLESRVPEHPIGIVGNSMGGAIAMAVAVGDPRVRACCSNGGMPAPGLVPPSVGTFFTKMVACCGDVSPERSQAIWSTVSPLAPGSNTGYPLLVLHGGADPMVTAELAQVLFEKAPTCDKQMVVFSDGDHCLYNHKADRDAHIADWIRGRFTASLPTAGAYGEHDEDH
ncbi:alpha/beta hydrolase [Micromonospora sp. RTGN7]|uniref:alpha/beta hydrolase n=1 Tax=Micromonospora sp. RTGN7 TaxID=3016526 RepID=UPI0029FEC85D|nr:alpha/beta fold hydrolase [Micromonospora sp. RTGN7]